MQDDEREIENIFKNQKLGKWSKGLQKGLTQYVKDTYDVNNISLLAWQNSENEKEIDFYKKNGYKLTGENSQIYDDSVIIYDLYKFEKNI